MSQVFGPVPSRRLGFSLGIDLVPFKTCTLDCVYCQLGRTSRKTVLRRSYIALDPIVANLKRTLARRQQIDYITLSGSGEPTLHSRIGRIIDEIKRMTDIPVAVLTNGTLLHLKSLRTQLSKADLVIPSLDATSQNIFDRVNRPHPSLKIDRVLSGLKDFREEFSGEIWIEVMLVKGINDGVECIDSMRQLLPEMGCNRIQLNTVIRPPSEACAQPLTLEEMLRIKERLGKNCEIIHRFNRSGQKAYREDLEEQILNLIGRRPVGIREISSALGLHENEVIKYLETLSETGRVRSEYFEGKVYYQR